MRGREGHTRWSPWRSMLAGAVIGFIEAAGSEGERRLVRGPEPVVRFQTREPDHAHRPHGLWFLAPIRCLKRYLSPN